MTHVVSRACEAFTVANGKLTVHQIPACQDNYIWIVVCNDTGDAAVIDGPQARPALDYCALHGIRLTAVMNTHTHWDHIGINRDLDALGHLDGLRVYGCGERAEEIPGLTDPVDEGDTIRIGRVSAKVWRTEGHLDGHLSYLFDGALFCGDTLFGAGCGYLFDGPPAKMQASLARFKELHPDTFVCCAHEYTQDNLRFAWSVEPDNKALARRIEKAWQMRALGAATVPSTIGLENLTNPFLRWASLTIQQNVLSREVASDDAVAVFAAIRILKDKKTYKAVLDAHLPLWHTQGSSDGR